QSNRKFYSFLVLPPLAMTGRHNRYRANAYAALSELNYHAFQSPPLPYNNCYLLEPKNAQGLEIGLSNLPLLIAQRIFLNIQGGTASTFIDSMMDNPQLGTAGGDLASNRKHSLRFSTFGLATVSYPREVISQCLAYYLSEKVVSAWIAQRDYLGDINQQVQNELQGLRLSFLHICGDADPFEKNDHLAYKTEIENLVDEKLQGVNKGQLGEKITRIRQEIEQGFRGKGIQEFYAQRQRDIAGASKVSLQQIRIKLTVFLCNPQLGVKYGKQFLDKLIKILNDFNGKFNEMISCKIDIFRENLN
ncbi:MAG: tubulin-like doman-containing protein, partial [Snowella sp.]